MSKVNLNLSKEQKEELKGLVEGEGFNYLEDIEIAKDNLSILANAVKDKFGIEIAMFKKLVKVNYKQSLDDERTKFSALETLWSEVFGDNDGEK